MAPGPKSLDYPLIFIQGWAAKPIDSRSHTWRFVEEYLTDAGIHYYVPDVNRYGSIEERAERIIEDVRSLYPGGQPVHLFGHSLGGLVARSIASRQDLGFRVLTVTTLGTPNRGVRYLDRIFTMDGDSPLAMFIRDIFGTDFGGLCNLSRKYIEGTFLEKSPNNPSVQYFSWAGHIGFSTLKYAAHLQIIGKYYSESDGVVGVESAEWGPDLGPGTHLGTVKGLTHTTIVSVELFNKSVPHLRAAELGKSLPVDSLDDIYVKPPIGRRIVGHVSSARGMLHDLKGILH